MAMINKCFILALARKYLQQSRKRRLQSNISDMYIPLLQICRRKGTLLKTMMNMIIMVTHMTNQTISRSVRRYHRNGGWWELVWQTYDANHFKENFRVTRATFMYILQKVGPALQKQMLTEEPVSPKLRLALCLYRLGRGDALHTISELTALGNSTVCTIVIEVCQILITILWESSVKKHFPSTKEEFIDAVTDMEHLWQFPFAFAAVGGCQLPLKCPPGGRESNKEYHNFKEFYSIVLMALVDANYRFIWASSGIPGNTHDSMIFQSSALYTNIVSEGILVDCGFNEGRGKINSIILGDSAFEMKPWLLKPFTNAVPTNKQKNFNYRLSRARMVVESAFGQLKGRWRVLLNKCESSEETVKLMSLACIVLHNLCIELEDKPQRTWDITRDPSSKKRRPRRVVRKLLQMRSCRMIHNRNPAASFIRNKLTEKFWAEKESGLVF